MQNNTTLKNQFSSVTQSCPTLCNPMDCSMPGFPGLHCLPESAQTHVHWVGDAIQWPHPVIPFCSCLQSFPASGSFPMRQLFTTSRQSIGASASASSPSSEYSGLISFRIDWLDLLVVQGTLKSLLQPNSQLENIITELSVSEFWVKMLLWFLYCLLTASSLASLGGH